MCEPLRGKALLECFQCWSIRGIGIETSPFEKSKNYIPNRGPSTNVGETVIKCCINTTDKSRQCSPVVRRGYLEDSRIKLYVASNFPVHFAYTNVNRCHFQIIQTVSSLTTSKPCKQHEGQINLRNLHSGGGKEGLRGAWHPPTFP